MRLSRELLFICTLWALPLGAVLGKEPNLQFRVIQISPAWEENLHEVGLWHPRHVEAEYNDKPNKPLTGLIIISHGFSGNLQGHRDTAEALARQGYLVAAPTHLDLHGLKLGQPDYDPLIARPKHIQEVIKFLINDPLFKQHPLKDNIGMIGFSLGAYTVLVSAGATPDFHSLDGYCEIKPNDILLCSEQAQRRLSSLGPTSLSAFEFDIKAAVLLAPAYGPLFSEQSLVKVDMPIKIYSAEQDRDLDNRFNAHHFARALPTNPEEEIVQEAGHFVFMAPCNDALKKAAPYICKDADAVNRKDIHRNMNRDIIEFFNRVNDSSDS